MQYEVEINGRLRQVVVHRSDGRFDVTIDGREWTVDAARVDAYTLSLLVGAAPGASRHASPSGSAAEAATGRTESHEVVVAPEPATGHLGVRIGPIPFEVAINDRRRAGRKEEGGHAGSGPQRIVAPMPGKIVKVLVKTGDAVRTRQPIIVVEAMKMENELRAGRDGIVTEIQAREGQSVDAGTLLAIISAGDNT